METLQERRKFLQPRKGTDLKADVSTVLTASSKGEYNLLGMDCQYKQIFGMTPTASCLEGRVIARRKLLSKQDFDLLKVILKASVKPTVN